MYVFDLNYPGRWLELGDKKRETELTNLLSVLESKIVSTEISLTLFEKNMAIPSNRQAELNTESELRNQIENELNIEHGYHLKSNYQKLDFEIKLRRKKAELGFVPCSYINATCHFYANSFVNSVDSFGRILEVIASNNELPDTVKECWNNFEQLLPTVREIRNSAMHIEDRVRGFGDYKMKRKNIKMDIKGSFSLGTLFNNTLVCTVADGSEKNIVISKDILYILVDITNDLLRCFEWSGDPHISPAY